MPWRFSCTVDLANDNNHLASVIDEVDTGLGSVRELLATRVVTWCVALTLAVTAAGAVRGEREMR